MKTKKKSCENRVAKVNLTPKLPHHHSYGSVSGGSEE